ncbi:MAG: triphosphoribosyl-dephospho-CoA synthase [Acidaminococcaceae bacterium]|nr:triphosphoribosyl-dephospho-CoA synthase [Acidaminococcaceae bacterium]
MIYQTYIAKIRQLDDRTDNLPSCRASSPCGMDLLQMGTYLAQAILLEVCTHPKPGLVTRLSGGSHTDMNIFTFAMSSAVLGQAFQDLLRMGYEFSGTPQELLKQVRIYGKYAEKRLLYATKGVNTQRGILFSGGIMSAAAGYAAANQIPKDKLTDVIREMTAGIVDRELRGQDKAEQQMTAGEILFHKYGIAGIRGEVEAGFPSVIQNGLPALQHAFSKKASLNDALLHTLLSLMTVVEDSNVIWRTDVETAEAVKQRAVEILEYGSVFTESGRDLIARTEKDFVTRRISPGGSADLLSVTIAVYLLENKRFPGKIL